MPVASTPSLHLFHPYINHRPAHLLPPIFQSRYAKVIPTKWQQTHDTSPLGSATASNNQATTSRLLHTRLNRCLERPGRRTTMSPMISRCAFERRLLQQFTNKSANIIAVRRLCRRSHPPDPHAVHPQGLRHPYHANPPHHGPQLHQLLLRLLQDMDSK
jgi:hypothetical protein